MSENKYMWTVMIYLAGNNSLSEECVFALTDMAASRLPAKVAVIAQLNTGVHDHTILHIHENGMTPAEIHAELKKALTKSNGTTEGLGLVDSGKRILEFVEHCKKTYPAAHYMLALSGHGSGTIGDFLRQEGKKSFTLVDLGKLLQDIYDKVFERKKKLDVLGLDTCLMSMSEVAYAIHNHVNVMIGAEGFEPGAGWPYKRVLKQVNNLIEDPKTLAKKIVCEYIDHYTIYQAANVSVDQSACDLDQAVDVMKAINSLSGVLKNCLEKYQTKPETEETPEQQKERRINAAVRDAVILCHWEAQLYKNEQYMDLYDFARC